MDDLTLLSVTDAARELGLKPWRLYQLVEAGQMPHKRVGGRVYFTREHLRRWVGIETDSVANRLELARV